METFTSASFRAELDSRGRVTVPARIRKRRGLEPGDRVRLSLDTGKLIYSSFETSQEALNFVQGLEDVESFSFCDGVLEVVLRE